MVEPKKYKLNSALKPALESKMAAWAYKNQKPISSELMKFFEKNKSKYMDLLAEKSMGKLNHDAVGAVVLEVAMDHARFICIPAMKKEIQKASLKAGDDLNAYFENNQERFLEKPIQLYLQGWQFDEDFYRNTIMVFVQEFLTEKKSDICRYCIYKKNWDKSPFFCPNCKVDNHIAVTTQECLYDGTTYYECLHCHHKWSD